MKRAILLLLSVITISAYAQNKNISTINTVKPKMGQKMAFETAYKQHIAKFHKSDEKMSVYEILSGQYAGTFHLVNGGRSFADMDKERTDAATHSMDLDQHFFPLLEESRNNSYRHVDSLSFHADVQAEKFLVNIRHIKSSQFEDYTKESYRGVIILGKLKGGFWENFSMNLYDQLWAGSDPVLVTVRSLKDGFKSLEDNFYNTKNDGNPSFKDEYIKAYGTLDWDKRTKLMDEAVVKRETYIMKLRRDLSSQ